jgi:hypothetical protein
MLHMFALIDHKVIGGGSSSMLLNTPHPLHTPFPCPFFPIKLPHRPCRDSPAQLAHLMSMSSDDWGADVASFSSEPYPSLPKFLTNGRAAKKRRLREYFVGVDEEQLLRPVKLLHGESPRCIWAGEGGAFEGAAAAAE